MKTLIATIFALFFTITLVSAQSTSLSTAEVQQLREERSVAIFNQQNKHDIAKQKAMGETYELNVEKADLENKRHEVQIVEDASFPKYAEMNNSQKASWEYAQAKKAWIEANPTKYAEMMQGASTK